MITKTDFQLLCGLDNFKPKRFFVINAAEKKQIRDALQISERDILSLRNLRNLVVIYMMGKDDATSEDVDKCSAITSVIDDAIINLGGEV